MLHIWCSIYLVSIVVSLKKQGACVCICFKVDYENDCYCNNFEMYYPSCVPSLVPCHATCWRFCCSLPACAADKHPASHPGESARPQMTRNRGARLCCSWQGEQHCAWEQAPNSPAEPTRAQGGILPEPAREISPGHLCLKPP